MDLVEGWKSAGMLPDAPQETVAGGKQFRGIGCIRERYRKQR